MNKIENSLKIVQDIGIYIRELKTPLKSHKMTLWYMFTRR